MKKFLLFSTALLVNLGLFSQSGQKFATNGNSLVNGDFLGSTNKQDLIFKTGNQTGASLNTSGVFQINNLAGSDSRIVQADANGNLISLAGGSFNQYLNGKGQWIDFPSVPSALWTQSGNTTIFYNGNVGINNAHPQFALDVTGDVHVSNNVYVGGGILISEKIQASASLKTDSINSLTGKTSFTSPVKLHSQFEVVGNSTFGGNVSANTFGANSLSVNTGSISNLTVGGSATLSNLRVNSFSGNSGGSFVYADSIGNFKVGPVTPMLTFITPCVVNAPWMIGGNKLGTVANAVIGTCDYHQFVLEANNTPYMWINPNGQIVFGQNNSLPVAAFDIQTNLANTSPLRITNSAMPTGGFYAQTPFEITSSGQVFIGATRPSSAPYTNSILSVAGTITSQEIFVIPTTAWADYVFKKGYKLMPWEDLAKYIAENEHLPNTPSAKEIEVNGQNVGKIQVLQMEKIEELTLYMLEMKKEIQVLQMENKELKERLEKR